VAQVSLGMSGIARQFETNCFEGHGRTLRQCAIRIGQSA
jgi:hypothetical protein